MRPPVLVFILITLASCLPIRFISSTHQYNVYIEPGFSDGQRTAIEASLREWETATQQTVTFVEVSYEDNSQALITMTPSTKRGMVKMFPNGPIGRCQYRGSNSHIYIATDLDKRDFYQTSLHEIGHSVGLEHDTNLDHAYQTTMMVHTLDSSTHLKCRDMIAFCNIWDCNASQFPLCKDNNPSL